MVDKYMEQLTCAEIIFYILKFVKKEDMVPQFELRFEEGTVRVNRFCNAIQLVGSGRGVL